ncbi:MAG: DUF3445 domain-containing protein [Alphaproteobacteria bacterium]|nr:DUF3445 domain-containing protein [Alphaproteobacteria bacterium]
MRAAVFDDPASAPRFSPWDKGRFQLSLGIKAIAPAEWIEVDRHYTAHLVEKRRLLTERHGEVFDALPESGAAQAECLDRLLGHLTRDHPGLVEIDGRHLRVRATGEILNRDDFATAPLDLAGRLVQEDLCLMAPGEGTWRLIAASLCFPARWRLADKLGRPMSAIHAPVPGFNAQLARPVDRFFAKVTAEQPYMRVNWSVIDDATLFQPTGHGRSAFDPTITPENLGDRLHLRVERQTFTALPDSGALVFGIKTVIDPIGVLADRPGLVATLRSTIATMPEDMRGYKSMAPFAGALDTYLAGLEAAAARDGATPPSPPIS